MTKEKYERIEKLLKFDNKVLWTSVNGSYDDSTVPHRYEMQGITSILFRFLRVEVYWRGHGKKECFCKPGEDSRGERCFAVHMNLTRSSFNFLHVQLFPWKDRYFTLGNLGYMVRTKAKRIWNWRRLKQLRLEIERQRKLSYDICNDPMCRCSEDFLEDFERKVDRLSMEYDKLAN